MIKFDEIKHLNTSGELVEGHIFKINNSDHVFFIVEKIIGVAKFDEEETPILSEVYVARKLDGQAIGELVYNSNNEVKRLSFEEGEPIKLEHVFVYGQMFKSFS